MTRSDLLAGELLRVKHEDQLFWRDIDKIIVANLELGDLLVFLYDEGKLGLRVLSSKFGIGNVPFVSLERV